MTLVPFSSRYPQEFLSRREDNFQILIDKMRLFYLCTREDIEDGVTSRRTMDSRFTYREELRDLKINDEGISTEEVIGEFNDMLQGSIRHQDPSAAFNIFPSPLFDAVAATALMNLYTPNALWDLLSGKLCLYEKKIVRMLGQLAGWSDADGYVVTGGKQALVYAIKNGLERAKKNTSGSMDDFVVLTSAVSHFCIEHVCGYLGIRANNCLRIPIIGSGEIDLAAFSLILEEAIHSGKRIAAVIAVGGATINFIPDSIRGIREIIDAAVTRCQLDYVPYLHVDSVISWTWLSFSQVPMDSWAEKVSLEVAEKIEHVLTKFSGIELVDSFAADFHKTGFCPYAAGVFIAKNVQDLAGMTLDKTAPRQDLRFGESEVYRQTLENSRPGIAIASIWITLRRLGLEGLRQYILYQLEVCECFKENIRKHYGDHFEILNEHTKGWDIIIKPRFVGDDSTWDGLQAASQDEQDAYANTCRQFLGDLWYGSLNGQPHHTPVIGFVKSYSRKGAQEKGLPAFLIHPCSLHYDQDVIKELLEGVVRAKLVFEQKLQSSEEMQEDKYLAEFVPPR